MLSLYHDPHSHTTGQLVIVGEKPTLRPASFASNDDELLLQYGKQTLGLLPVRRRKLFVNPNR